MSLGACRKSLLTAGSLR